jgi:tetratricopeptide (TPR) repeat protein
VKLVQRYMIARRLQQRGLFAWAKREYKYIIEQGKSTDAVAVRTQIELANMLHDQGDDLAAAGELEAILKKPTGDKPFIPDVTGHSGEEIRGLMYYFQACHWERNKDQAKMRECLDKAFALDPSNIDVLIACYRLPEQTPEYHKNILELIRKTAEEIQEEITAQPDSSDNYNQYAWLIGNTEGNLDEAWKCSQKSLELSPNNSAYYDTLARIYYAKGDYENAVKHQQRAAELDPHSGLITKQLVFFRKAWEEHKK